MQRRGKDGGLPHPPPGGGAQGPPPRARGARGAVGQGPLGVEPAGPVACQQGLRRAHGQLQGLDRLRQALAAPRGRPVGRNDAAGPHRRRGLGRPRGVRRRCAGRHLWGELRGICHSRWPGLHPRGLLLRRRHCRARAPPHPAAVGAGLLGADEEDADPARRRRGERRHPQPEGLALLPRQEDRAAAPHRAGGQRPPREAGRERPNGAGDALGGYQGGVCPLRRRGARLRTPLQPCRLLSAGGGVSLGALQGPRRPRGAGSDGGALGVGHRPRVPQVGVEMT
mmetsp:Transcript_20345/g.51343  ORF Transcript_20345/g.51343 Transcript_20345/m.51343 type:complete len:282 (+) Transcript_20345:1130-1975(+)